MIEMGRVMSNLQFQFDVAAVLLTPREREIIAYVLAGKANKVIAIELGISLRTAEAHRARIFKKMGVRSVLQLACRTCVYRRAGLRAVGSGADATVGVLQLAEPALPDPDV